jgi:hypothetical protein
MRCRRGRASRLRAKETASTCSAEKPCLDQGIEYLATGDGVESPQALDLTPGEKQSWDFEIFAADDLDPVLDGGFVIGLASDAR